MTPRKRLRDWIAGRQDFRALVEVDPRRATPLAGRPVRGSMAVEIDHVTYGSRARARIDAVAQIRSRLDVEVPGARLLALLDGGPPRPPEPVLRLAKGRRPRLLLIDEDARAEPGHLVDRVARMWGLPAGHYAAPRVPEPFDRRPGVALLVAGFVLALPLMVSALYPAPFAPGELLVTRLWRGGALAAAGFGVSVALAVTVVVVAQRRRWTVDRKWRTASTPLLPSFALGVVVLLGDSVALVGLRFPAAVAAVLAALCIAALPVLVSRIERPALWAVLAWGLPLLGGGVAVLIAAIYCVSAFQWSSPLSTPRPDRPRVGCPVRSPA